MTARILGGRRKRLKVVSQLPESRQTARLCRCQGLAVYIIATICLPEFLPRPFLVKVENELRESCVSRALADVESSNSRRVVASECSLILSRSRSKACIQVQEYGKLSSDGILARNNTEVIGIPASVP